MIKVRMPVKEYNFLKSYYDAIDRYVVQLDYLQDADVVMHVPDNRFEDFLLDYRSMIVRKGFENEQAFNEAGVRLNSIYERFVRTQED